MSIKILAEVGINHGGNLKIAKELIDIAIFAKCDIVKFQVRNIGETYSQKFLDSPRQGWKNQREQKMALEFNEKQYDEINAYCQEKKIQFMVSAWGLKALNFLKQYDLKYNKIASAMLWDLEFVSAVAKEMKHTFISTGMSTIEEIEQAVQIFKQYDCSFELMACTSTYPMKDEHANLNRIRTLQNYFHCDVGWSGHETGLQISIAAAAMGITSLERHITLSRTMEGSDQAASLEPTGLIRLVRDVRIIEQAMGDGRVAPIPEELVVRKKFEDLKSR